MVAFYERYHHRRPAAAKTTMLGGDLIACVMSGVYTDVEKTMIEIQQKPIVQETRNAFQTPCNTGSQGRSRPVRAQGAGVHLQSPRRPGRRDRTVLPHPDGRREPAGQIR